MEMKHLRTDLVLSEVEILRIFKLAKELKAKVRRSVKHELLRGKSLAMIFAKPSTRTRVSFEVGMTQLGGHALYLGPNDLQLSRGETIGDTARVLSRYVDVIMARVFAQSDIEELASNSTVPVINGLSDMYHPCQSLTDYFTLWERFGKLTGKNITFIGDGDNNVTNSLLLTGAQLGLNVTIVCPDKYRTNIKIFNKAAEIAKKTNAQMVMTNDPARGVAKADVVYTDVWVSMGRNDVEERKKVLWPYQVNQELLNCASKKVLIMHCLPAHRGEEITNDVIDSKNSIVFDQAENRLHVQKALLVSLLRNKI